jgi:hypothetical protein
MGPEIVYPACYLGQRVGIWTVGGECIRGILVDIQALRIDGYPYPPLLILDQWFGKKDGPYQMFNFTQVVSIEPLDEPREKKV